MVLIAKAVFFFNINLCGTSYDYGCGGISIENNADPRDCVVTVISKNIASMNNIYGAGVFVAKTDDDVYVATALHVVQAAENELLVIYKEDTVHATIFSKNEGRDIAIIKMSNRIESRGKFVEDFNIPKMGIVKPKEDTLFCFSRSLENNEQVAYYQVFVERTIYIHAGMNGFGDYGRFEIKIDPESIDKGWSGSPIFRKETSSTYWCLVGIVLENKKGSIVVAAKADEVLRMLEMSNILGRK